jgi:hypothetical protein
LGRGGNGLGETDRAQRFFWRVNLQRSAGSIYRDASTKFRLPCGERVLSEER